MPVNVSIIICTRNRAESVRQTIEAMSRVVVPGELSPQLYVVDNGSTDATSAAIRGAVLPQMPVRYVLEHRRGLSRSRNAGMAAATGDLILFTDDDVRPTPDWLMRMCHPLTSGEADAVAGGVTIAPRLLRAWMSCYLQAVLASTESLDAIQPDRLIGANMGFSRHVLSRIPHFDCELGAGALGYGEETLFAAQLLAAGFRIRGALDAVVEHHFSPSRLSRQAFLAAAEKSGRSEAYMEWHWNHASDGGLDGSAAGYQHDARQWAKLIRHRLKHPRDPEVPTTEWEFQQIKAIAFRRQLRIESRRPRNYEKFGMTKLR